ncbi:uncharacterized protein LOC126973155 [Leptidea sinapis]|uniref:uncharacterized protein LOC126973155 n=1 Tax=Leptidea sinapis TaxID=189913 RepID=UPI0021C33E2A|nr:uncharacterized protein LOC126973155 [Leptidea sinapis]
MDGRRFSQSACVFGHVRTCYKRRVRAPVLVRSLLRLSLAVVLLLVPLRLPQVRGLTCRRCRLCCCWCCTRFFIIKKIAFQVTGECKNCVVLGKEERAMFRAHSEACAAQSHVSAGSLSALLGGAVVRDEPALRRHVYCVLQRCKLIGKDGKLLKAALLGKLGARQDARIVTKVLETCAEQTGDTPEDLAWNLFRCGYDRKAVLFHHMPAGDDGALSAS